jgi:hypothetical protein
MKKSHGFKLAAAILLGITGLFWIVTSIIGMLRGVPRELNNILMILAAFLLGYLAWKRPLLGGILLTVFAVLMAIYFLVFDDFLSTALVAMVLLCAPAIFSGLLFIESDWTSKKRN